MGLCPFAVHRLLPENETQGRITPRLIILHSAAGRGSIRNWFDNDGITLESHFWVSETGVIEQYMDTTVRADANRNANGYAISIESESSKDATERWSPEAAASIVKLCDWLCDTHQIPRVQCQRPDGSGIGWHIMFGAPGPWTPVAKACPGVRRIPQARDEIIPAVARMGTGQPPPEEDDMPLNDADKKWIKDTVSTEVAKAVAAIWTDEATDVKAVADARRAWGSQRGWLAAIAENLGVKRERAIALDPTNKD